MKRLHAATIGPFFFDSRAVSDHVGPHQRMLVARDGMDAATVEPVTSDNIARLGTLVHLIFPNTIIIYHPDYTSHLGTFPIAPDESSFVHTMLTPETPVTEKAQSHWDRSFALIDGAVFNREDLFICEQIQRGLFAGTRETFVLGRFEANVRRFHDTIAAALGTDPPIG